MAKGDCDLNGILNIFDVLKLVAWLGPEQDPSPGNEEHAGDVDDNGVLDNYDLVALIDILNG